MPSSKLREVTSQASVGRSIAVNSRDIFEAGEIMTGKRSTRAKDKPDLKTYNESDDDPDGWDEESEDSVDFDLTAQRSRSPVEMPRTSEDESEDEDDHMEEAPPPPPKQAPSRPTSKSTTQQTIRPITQQMTRPTIQQTTRPNTKSAANPAVIVTPATADPVTSVEEKEMEMENDEDEELSELDSNGDEGEQDETMLDAEGDEEEIGAEDDAEGDEDIDAEGQIDSDDETPGSGTGSPKAQTKRQRGQDEGAFLALPMEPQIKKILTADEHRMRRAEMARRRKNLSEKRNEEEKVDLSLVL